MCVYMWVVVVVRCVGVGGCEVCVSVCASVVCVHTCVQVLSNMLVQLYTQ